MTASSQMSPSLGHQAMSQQQQMGVYQQLHPGAVSFNPLQQQPHGMIGQQHLQQQQPALYNQQSQQQMMAPVTPMSQQPGSQQQMPTPMSNAPKTPATPQQQQHLQQPHSIGQSGIVGGQQQPHSQQQPGSVQMQQPASIGAPYGPIGSIPAPLSGSSMTSTTSKPSTQQPTQSQQIPTTHTELVDLDPIAAARMLILKDLRRSIVELNSCADKIVEGLTKPLAGGSSQTGGSNVVTVSGERHDDKKPTIGGPHSDHSIGPQSNLGFGPHSVNPHSVQNPLSVQNPQSVNPQSNIECAFPPGSVKSADESGKKEHQIKLSQREQYEMAKNNFMNVCDNIERNLLLVLEVNRQQTKLYNQQTGLAVAWQPELNAPNLSLPQALQGFTNLMNADKQAIRANIDYLNSLMEKFSGGTVKMEE